MTDSVLKNIPSFPLNGEVLEHDTMRATIRQMKRAKINISSFAIVQFLQGAALYYEQLHEKNKLEKVSITETKLLTVLYMSAPISTVTPLTINREELIALRKWLETRMRHCEIERDERNPKFSPDTYIGQKLLLLDIRELLLGEIIEDGNTKKFQSHE